MPWSSSGLFRRTAAALVVTNLVTGVAAACCLASANAAAGRSEETFVALADDVTRASQAQVAAERMVAVGRAYLLTLEPELRVRAQAAEAKLARILRLLRRESVRPEETDRLDQLKITGSRYRELFLALLSDASIDDEPSVIASALRTSLIPARDELSSELESLVMRRKEALDASRTSARTTRARWMSAFVAVAVAGVALSAVLLRLMISRRRAYLPIPGRDARYEAGAPDSRRPSGTSRRWKTRPSHRPVA